MALNSRMPCMPRLEMALAPPSYSSGLSSWRARVGEVAAFRRRSRQGLPSALRTTGVSRPPSTATATPISARRKRRMRSSAHTALAAGTRERQRPGFDDEVVERQLERRLAIGVRARRHWPPPAARRAARPPHPPSDRNAGSSAWPRQAAPRCSPHAAERDFVVAAGSNRALMRRAPAPVAIAGAPLAPPSRRRAATMRPCGPEPLRRDRSMPASPASRRASGVTKVPPDSFAGP